MDGVVIKDGQVLLVKRKFNPFKGKHALPGGFIDWGETAERAVVREVYEETGIRVKPVKLINFYSDPKRDYRRGTVAAAYLCKATGGKVNGSFETEAGWFKVQKKPKLAFDHEKILKDALK